MAPAIRGATGSYGAPAALLAVLGAVGLGLVAEGLWIPAKAAAAQVLLHRAWAAAQRGAPEVKPWPWADTWPVARLAAPGHGVELVVLAGAHGASLPFAPAHLEETAQPGSPGTTLIAGHRDTHFEFLRRVRLGDELRLETPAGGSLRYEVVDLEIVDTREQYFLPVAGESGGPGDATLVLVTCYPFETALPGGPLRYVVTARTQAESVAVADGDLASRTGGPGSGT